MGQVGWYLEMEGEMGLSRKQKEKIRSGWCCCCLIVVLLTIPFSAVAETVKLPMTVDFALLRSLVAQQAYPEPEERAGVVVMNEGCNEIWLSSPQLGEENGEVRFQTDIHVVWGTPVAGNCVMPIRWSGTVVFWQQPKIDNDWRLRFVTRDSKLFNPVGEKAAIPSLIWELLKSNVHGYIDSIAVNLAPPIDNLKQFMQPQPIVFASSPAERFIASMHPEQPQVKKHSLAFNILAESDVPLTSEEDELGVPPIEDSEMEERLLALWQTWDALLVNMIGQLSSKELSIEDRQLLLDTLLSVRYEFSEVIGGPGLTTNFIRRQFITSWAALKPLFERHLAPNPADNLLGYLSFFTAADALVVLDRIGPMLGIDISREGFYRLAHMLSDRPLDETGEVNSPLRDLLGFGAPLAIPQPEVPAEIAPVEPEAAPIEPTPTDAPSADVPFRETEPSGGEEPQKGTAPFVPVPNEELLDDTGSGASYWPDWKQVFGVAEACAATTPQLDKVSGWTAELTPAEQLLPRVRLMLGKSAKKLEDKLDATVGEAGWGQRLLETTAWQESCFRQFIVKDKKITYLLSYNNTSVGVMQVNEKVWRGIYDLKELRWNIEYNIMAGSEILALYLNRYVAAHKDFLGKTEEPGRKYLATWLYALYNGGPGQLKKFPQRSASKKLYRTDLSFQERFEDVQKRGWETKVDCLPKG
ncbi:hypothetical protein SAMN02745220_01753 [Desulfopila aestuarii DSM 18488]|uniref:Transglycosylase SLT domain-containing protein n=2 Tax=Desulfopila aestuarii TaxID=231440 RepID=A0A1M7Y4D7_9BACT|nr:hypothetical protein SAMN02745220_01753 [Desulfopila aestuarii DSM 18488]